MLPLLVIEAASKIEENTTRPKSVRRDTKKQPMDAKKNTLPIIVGIWLPRCLYKAGYDPAFCPAC
jgi:hypothetical protein